MSRKHRSDSVKGELENMQAAYEGPIQPPSHVHIREQDKPFWYSIVQARAKVKWNESDLEVAANLARCKSDIERIQKEIDAEGDVVENARGTPVVNPKHTLLETLSRRAVALSKMIHVHAEATMGQAKDQRSGNSAAEKAREAARQSESDDLIARPKH